MRILFYTFPEGHLVSDKEFDRMKVGFAKRGMELIRWHKDRRSKEPTPEHDINMVKGWSHRYSDIVPDAPLVYLSIGTEWKLGEDLQALNEPIRDLYDKAQATVHISQYCAESHHAVFGRNPKRKEGVIIPAAEPNLPTKYPPYEQHMKMAITCIPRPVKRVEELQRLARQFGIVLVEAFGTVDDFSYYHDCHGYIHLSRKEGMPNTVLEAMAYGLPCIVTNYGGAKEAVGDAGIVIKTDPESGPWDPAHIEGVDDILFEEALAQFRTNLHKLRIKVRERVRSDLNDYMAACRFANVFKALTGKNV